MPTINHGDAQLFINWLKTKPRDVRYNYGDHKRCLIAQYLTACGFKHVNVGVTEFDYVAHDRLVIGKIPTPLNIIAVGHPFTFGAALDRAFLEFNKIADASGHHPTFKPF